MFLQQQQFNQININKVVACKQLNEIEIYLLKTQ